jgi:TPR repeat protein
MKWLRKAAGQGHAQAQLWLAKMYEGREGIRRNVSAAMKWYRKAGDQGDEEAKDRLRELEHSHRRRLLSIVREKPA